PRTACPASPSLRFRLRLARSLHRPEMFARDGFCRGSRTTPRSRAEPHAVEHFAGARPGHGLVWLWPEELEHAGITPADLNTPVGVDEPVAAAARIVRRPGQRRRRRRRPPRLPFGSEVVVEDPAGPGDLPPAVGPPDRPRVRVAIAEVNEGYVRVCGV